MKPKDWFEVGLRLLGIWQLLEAATYLVSYLNILARFSSLQSLSANGYLTHCIGYIIAGFILLFCAPKMVDAAYPFIQSDPPQADDSRVR